MFLKTSFALRQVTDLVFQNEKQYLFTVVFQGNDYDEKRLILKLKLH